MKNAILILAMFLIATSVFAGWQSKVIVMPTMQYTEQLNDKGQVMACYKFSDEIVWTCEIKVIL